MTRRQLLPLLGLVALVLTSGCAGFFGSQPISDDQLDEEPPAPYVWDNDVNAHITITENARFQAVYRMDRTRMELFRRDGLGGRNAIPVSAVRYRYPNGTVIAGTEFVARGGSINPSRERVSVALPGDAPGDGGGDVEGGGGPVIARGTTNTPALVEAVREAADGAGIDYQLQAAGIRTGTDADAFYTSSGGTPALNLGLPNRYMHTPVEVVDQADLDAAASLLAGVAGRLEGFAPFDVGI